MQTEIASGLFPCPDGIRKVYAFRTGIFPVIELVSVRKRDIFS